MHNTTCSFSLWYHVCTGSGANQASYPLGTWGAYFSEHEAAFSAKIKNVWTFVSLPYISSWYGA
jgi:hypothetical protein